MYTQKLNRHNRAGNVSTYFFYSTIKMTVLQLLLSITALTWSIFSIRDWYIFLWKNKTEPRAVSILWVFVLIVLISIAVLWFLFNLDWSWLNYKLF